MKIYNSYQEAKIENPDCDICVLERKSALMYGKFQAMKNPPLNDAWKPCSPREYLPSMEWFFSENYKLFDGDVIMDLVGNVIFINGRNHAEFCNYKTGHEKEFFILRAFDLNKSKFTTETQEEKEELDMIDTTSKQVESLAKGGAVEWNNGDECIYHGETYIYQCVASWDSDACILSGKSRNSHSLTDAWIEELSKPESPEQKVDRERLEAAYDLYCLAIGESACMYQVFLASPILLGIWCKVVDKTGYRKEQ